MAAPATAISAPVANLSPVAASCDGSRLVAALAADSQKAMAWARVLDLGANSVGPYVGTLAPGILLVDTRFTNEGYSGGQLAPRQSVLQAGTAVLRDPTGVAVVRCESGTPLLPPQPVSGTPNYSGSRWPGFNPTALVASSAPPQSVLQANAGPTSAASPFRQAATDLVVDGGFEQGLVAPWGTGQYEPRPAGIFWGSANATATVVDGIAHSGTHSLVISNFSAQAPQVYRTLSQKVAVTTGARYCLSFWAKTTSASPGIASFPLDKAWLHNVQVPPGSNDWAMFAGTMTAEGPSLDVRVVTGNKGQVAIDDIMLTAGGCLVPDGAVAAGQAPR